MVVGGSRGRGEDGGGWGGMFVVGMGVGPGFTQRGGSGAWGWYRRQGDDGGGGGAENMGMMVVAVIQLTLRRSWWL